MGLFFKPKFKAQKDRAILKKIDQTLSRQGLPSALMHFVLYVIIEWHLLQSEDAPNIVYFFGLLLFIMAAWRFILITQFESLYAKGPGHWREVFIVSGFMHAGTWSSYIVYRLATLPEEPMMLLGILYTSAIATGGTFVYSLYGNAVRYFLAILLGPLFFYFTFIQTSAASTAVGAGIIMAYFYLVGTGSRMAELIWTFLARNHEYKLRLSAFEQAREANSIRITSNRRFIRQLLNRLKNPLGSLIGVLGTLSVDDNDVENQGMLRIAKRSGYSMLDLIKDLEAFLDQRDRKAPDSSVFNLRKTLETALSEMGGKAHEKGRELSYLYHPEVPERIESDPIWLTNAFRRMIDFTIDMATQGEITVKINSISKHDEDALLLTFYFENSQISNAELLSVIERQLGELPEDEDVVEQLTLMIASAQFKAMGATLDAESKGELHKISVQLPIKTTSQQASSFKPSKYMAGKSIVLIDLSPQNRRSLAAEFESWGMNISVWKIDDLLQQSDAIESDFVFINVPVDDKKARKQLKKINSLQASFSAQARYVLYASELQHKLLDELSVEFIFVEKPVARDQLLSALRDANDKQGAADQQVQFHFTDTKILVADNNLLSQKVILKLLDQVGAEVDTCTNGIEVTEMMQKTNYDLILMDSEMPMRNALETTQVIRQTEQSTGLHVPIIMMSAEQDPEFERESLTAGVDDFLIKPLQLDDVVQLIQRWVG
ncbi:hybrid sensor histidine kinase/response regulator [Reinekea thalattae]|uniref:Response regulator n=1 Tax=Reinekea thalattae TaxID=2593301 RepID=A0A5C8Z861_9GAMM|nr:response regulator [Reinekea thalattae]TXR53509.1 response regulator [Reinekea thalattae]